MSGALAKDRDVEALSRRQKLSEYRHALSEDQPDEDDIEALVDLGHNLIQQVLERAPLTTLKHLVDAGAPLWYQDDDGLSALHAAAHIESQELVEYLIEKGAVWNAGAHISQGVAHGCDI